jgi:hypothetical protein
MVLVVIMYDSSGLLVGECAVCNRAHTEVALKTYGFGQPEKTVNLAAVNPDDVVQDNPHHHIVAVCGTDYNLLLKIRKQNRNFNPTQIMERAKVYRKANPVTRT